MSPAPGLVPVTLLTGFLGSGKTTVLSHLLKQPAMAGAAVVINEVGEVGIDDLLIGQDAQAGKPVLLEGGCVCCAVRDDLCVTLQELWVASVRGEIPQLRRVIVETTGLADPIPVLSLLMTDPFLARHFTIDGVVTTVDAVHGAQTIAARIEAHRQAAVADRLLITKRDIAAPQITDALVQQLEGLNPGARICFAEHGVLAPDALIGTGLFDPATNAIDLQRWLRTEGYEGACCEDAGAHAHHAHHHSVQSFCVIKAHATPWGVVDGWMQGLSQWPAGRLLRVKGVVDVAECPGEPVLLNGVQRFFHPPIRLGAWPSDDHRTRIVVIAEGVARNEVDQLFSE